MLHVCASFILPEKMVIIEKWFEKIKIIMLQISWKQHILSNKHGLKAMDLQVYFSKWAIFVLYTMQRQT